MSVSVIIPLFNKERYVARALQSVITQTHPPDDIIVIDDGSTDRSVDVVREFRDHRITLIEQPNAGPGAARNRGLQLVETDFVAFLDADDCWSANYLRHGLTIFRESDPNVAAVACGYRNFPGGLSTTDLWRRRRIIDGIHRLQRTSDPGWCVHLLAYLSPCTTIARADIVRRFGGFYDQDRCLYGEDAYLWLQVLLSAPVATRLTPLVDIHCDASDLGHGARRARPIEPLLTDPDPLYAGCAAELHPLLKDILAQRAMKTAAVMGYWGRWREGRALLRRFVSERPSQAVHRLAAHVCASPLGSALGRAHRTLANRRRAALCETAS